jgi:hypothetical protein
MLGRDIFYHLSILAVDLPNLLVLTLSLVEEPSNNVEMDKRSRNETESHIGKLPSFSILLQDLRFLSFLFNRNC